jgi:hypothetical protein
LEAEIHWHAPMLVVAVWNLLFRVLLVVRIKCLGRHLEVCAKVDVDVEILFWLTLLQFGFCLFTSLPPITVLPTLLSALGVLLLIRLLFMVVLNGF